MCKGRDAGNGKEGRRGARGRIHREKGEIERSEGSLFWVEVISQKYQDREKVGKQKNRVEDYSFNCLVDQANVFIPTHRSGVLDICPPLHSPRPCPSPEQLEVLACRYSSL